MIEWVVSLAERITEVDRWTILSGILIPTIFVGAIAGFNVLRDHERARELRRNLLAEARSSKSES